MAFILFRSLSMLLVMIRMLELRLALSGGRFLVGEAKPVRAREFAMSFMNKSKVLGTDEGLNSSGSMLCVSISFSASGSSEGAFSILGGLVFWVLVRVGSSVLSSRFMVKLFMFFFMGLAWLVLETDHGSSHIGSPFLKKIELIKLIFLFLNNQKK